MRAKIEDHLFIQEILSKDGQTRPISLSISTKKKVSSSSERILLLHQRYSEKVEDQLPALTRDRRINCP